MLFRVPALLGIVVAFAGVTDAQPMLDFPADTVIAERCTTGSPQSVLFGHNPSGEGFTLTWWETVESFPTSGFATMIIHGKQFIPQYPGGQVMLSGVDSVEFVFEMYPESMSPGDTAMYQIVAFNQEDSAGTAVLLTSLIVCPETTSTVETEDSPGFVLYPNPAHGQVSLISDDLGTRGHFDIYSMTGKRLHTVPAAEAGAPVAVYDWPAGAYIVCLVADGRIRARQTLVITP
jgi:hypothetical protein